MKKDLQNKFLGVLAATMSVLICALIDYIAKEENR